MPTLSDDIRSAAGAFQHLADSIPAVMQGDFPSLIFVISDEQKPPPQRNPKATSSRPYEPEPTRQAVESESAWVELFQTEGEYSTFIPGRFFNVLKVDATKVTPANNKYLCSEKAPIIILTHKGGKVAASFEGRVRIKRSTSVETMCDIMKKDGLVQNMTPFGRLQELMNSLETVEIALAKADEKMRELNQKLKDAQERDAKLARKLHKPEKPGTGTLYSQKAAEDFRKSTLLQTGMQKYDILTEEFTLLKQIGLPVSRMPKEPVRPEESQTSQTTSESPSLPRPPG